MEDEEVNRAKVRGKGKQHLWQTKQNSLNNWCASSLYILLFCWLRYSIYVMWWLQTGNPLSFTDIGNQNLQNFWCCIWLENPCTSEQTATWFLPFATFLEMIQGKGRVHRNFLFRPKLRIYLLILELQSLGGKMIHHYHQTSIDETFHFPVLGKNWWLTSSVHRWLKMMANILLKASQKIVVLSWWQLLLPVGKYRFKPSVYESLRQHLIFAFAIQS